MNFQLLSNCECYDWGGRPFSSEPVIVIEIESERLLRKKMILNEPQLTSLRTNVLDFQKETVTLFTDKINDINKNNNSELNETI